MTSIVRSCWTLVRRAADGWRGESDRSFSGASEDTHTHMHSHVTQMRAKRETAKRIDDVEKLDACRVKITLKLAPNPTTKLRQNDTGKYYVNVIFTRLVINVINEPDVRRV